MFTSHSRQGFTLIELLVVISIIAILAGLLLPAVTLVKNKANQTANGNNQKQIVTAMVAYQGDNDGSWPVAIGSTQAVATAADAKKIAYASFESLAATCQLPNGIFKAKGQSQATVVGVAKLWTDSVNFDASNWSARGTGGEIAWAYDWSAPSEVASVRVVVADRANWHKTKVVAVTTDSALKLFTTASGTAITIGVVDATTVAVAAMGGTVNPDAAGGGASGEFAITAPNNVDAIYSSVADGTIAAGAGVVGNTTLSNGDNRRAFVK